MSRYHAMFTVNSVHRNQRLSVQGDDGFSLLELTVTMFLVAILAASTVVFGHTWITHASLYASSIRMVEDLRYAQASAVNSGHPWTVALSKYTPDYAIYDDVTCVSRVGFASGVDYLDGYLQMASGRITYDAMGNGQVSGVVRLHAGDEEADLTLYMGAGLQSLSEIRMRP